MCSIDASIWWVSADNLEPEANTRLVLTGTPFGGKPKQGPLRSDSLRRPR